MPRGPRADIFPLCSRDSLTRVCGALTTSQPLSSTPPRSVLLCAAPTSAHTCPMSLLYTLHSVRRRASSSSHLARGPPGNSPSRVLGPGSPLARSRLRWAASYALIALEPATVVSFQAQVTHSCQQLESEGAAHLRIPLQLEFCRYTSSTASSVSPAQRAS